MIKYNRDKRGTYNARIRTRTTQTYDKRNAYDRRNAIHIPIRYDTQTHTIYVPIIYGKTRNNKAHIYTSVTNVIRDIFPSIDAPHTQHTYRAIAPYHKYIPQDTYHTRPQNTDQTIYTDIRRVKCIVFNAHDKILYVGTLRRTTTYNMTTHEGHTTLHKGNRSVEVMPYIPTMTHIHGMTIQEIRKYDVEFYHI